MQAEIADDITKALTHRLLNPATAEKDTAQDRSESLRSLSAGRIRNALRGGLRGHSEKGSRLSYASTQDCAGLRRRQRAVRLLLSGGFHLSRCQSEYDHRLHRHRVDTRSPKRPRAIGPASFSCVSMALAGSAGGRQPVDRARLAHRIRDGRPFRILRALRSVGAGLRGEQACRGGRSLFAGKAGRRRTIRQCHAPSTKTRCGLPRWGSRCIRTTNLF